MASILRLGASVAVALVVLPASAPGGPTGSGLYGTVRMGPVKPVCRQGVPCDAPAQVVLVFTRMRIDGTVQAATDGKRARSTELGKYRIALDPGYYELRAARKIGMSKLPRPHAVHIRRGHWDKIDLFFDTGIR
jgi:hypothetical protein